MSVATELQRIIDAKDDLKTAIEAKGVTVPASALIDDYPALVDSIPTGGGIEPKTVNFIDPDGTLVAAYTGVEAQALTELPTPIDHSEDEVPLTFDEWNWTLADIKSYNTSWPDATIWVGATYHATDNKCHIIVDIKQGDDMVVSFSCKEGPGEIDWGDGTVETGTTGTNSHEYSSIGRYHIKRTPQYSNSYPLTFSNQSTIIEYYESGAPGRLGYFTGCATLTKVYFSSESDRFYDSNSVRIDDCYSLKCVVMPDCYDSSNYCRVYSFSRLFNVEKISTPRKVYVDSYLCCTKLKSVTISDRANFTAINTNGLFVNCYSLEKIVFPDTFIGYQSCLFGIYLDNVRIPLSWWSQNPTSGKFGGQYTGQRTYIRNVILPSGLTTVFIIYLYGVEELNVPEGVTSVAIKQCSVKKISLPSTMESFASTEAFNGCTGFKSINIPSLITEIPGYTFYNCSDLEDVVFGGAITSIGNYAFANTNIKSITIPSSVTSIGNNAFYNYTLNTVTIEATTPPTLGTSAWRDSHLQKIYVPYSSDHSILTAYQGATNWSSVASKMEELPE